MEKKSIVDIIGDAQTMQEVFSLLKESKLRIADMSEHNFSVVIAKKEFALVLSDVGMSEHCNMIHPYGTRFGYYIN